MNGKEIMTKKFYWLFILLFWISFSIVLLHMFIYPNNNVLKNVEFPFGKVFKVFIVNDQIYINSDTYCRVQCYDSNGNFKFGFFYPSKATITYKNNNFHIIGYKRYDILDLKGNVLEQYITEDEERKKLRMQFPYKQDSRIKILWKFLSDEIIIEANQKTIKEEITLKAKWYFFLITAPFPMFIYLLITILLNWKYRFHKPLNIKSLFQTNYKISYLIKNGHNLINVKLKSIIQRIKGTN